MQHRLQPVPAANAIMRRTVDRPRKKHADRQRRHCRRPLFAFTAMNRIEMCVL